MKIGILALQGAFAEHAKVLDQLGVESVEIRNLDDFQKHQSDLSGIDITWWRIYNHGQALT